MSISGRTLRVAVVGSGPSGFYATRSTSARGLGRRRSTVRTPPHAVRARARRRRARPPEHQAVTRVCEETAEHPGFRFFGHRRREGHHARRALEARYDAIVWAVGDETTRRSGIPGEDLPGVASATELVGWYNGHPDFRSRAGVRRSIKRAVVIGNGNVSSGRRAHHGARARGAAHDSDIAHYALEVLAQEPYQEVVVLGRRGPAEAAFSPKEVKRARRAGPGRPRVDPGEAELDPVVPPVAGRGRGPSPPGRKRGAAPREVCGQATSPGTAARRIELRFLRSPVEIRGDGPRRGGRRPWGATGSGGTEGGALRAEAPG